MPSPLSTQLGAVSLLPMFAPWVGMSFFFPDSLQALSIIHRQELNTRDFTEAMRKFSVQNERELLKRAGTGPWDSSKQWSTRAFRNAILEGTWQPKTSLLTETGSAWRLCLGRHEGLGETSHPRSQSLERRRRARRGCRQCWLPGAALEHDRRDPREPHGSLLFHRLPSAGASRWSLLLCNTHTRLPWELLPDVTLALEAAEFRGSLLLLYLSSRTVPLEEGGFLRTLGGPFGLHQWKSSSICQPQLPILETAKRDIKKGADVRMCAGRGWGRLGPFMLRAFLSVWGRGRGFGQMLSFRSSPPISLHTPTRSSPPISLHTPTRVSWVATQGLLRPPVSLTGRSLPPQGAQMSPFHLQSGPRTFMRGQPEAPGTGPSWSLSEWGSFPASTACFQASGKGALRLQARHSSVAKHTAWGLLSPLLLWT
ncbi:uncharacterized protein LOC132359594 isoform X2 [Balaenoptera ricei]|uniref:uncharacterized protein LOC132359594 isoform X2 n=1 Tax=Balaenoptera ricei TaxID=2746895 RepID=UPI0028BE5E68|nr:uncharacterized protein LOC132359594 isoform X2 [Balaenoptera ricei]